MIIRKLFTFESSHAVRNAYSSKCRENVHGHSYKVEVFLSSNKLDKSGMVMDFTLLKEDIGGLIEAFDHTHIIWTKDSTLYKEFFKETNKRWIEMSVNPTAENISLVLFKLIDNILARTAAKREEEYELYSIRIHETATGFAQCFKEDMKDFLLEKIFFSEELQTLYNLPKSMKMKKVTQSGFWILKDGTTITQLEEDLFDINGMKIRTVDRNNKHNGCHFCPLCGNICLMKGFNCREIFGENKLGRMEGYTENE